MPVKNALSDEGLTWGEMIEVQKFLISFQCGTRTKEALMLRIVDLLHDRKSMNVQVWEGLGSIIENVGFIGDEARQLIAYIKENYRKRQN